MLIPQLAILLILPALVPFLLVIAGVELKFVLLVAAPLNLIAWLAVAYLLFWSAKIKQTVSLLAQDLRFNQKERDELKGLELMLAEIRRRSQLLSSDLLQQSLSSAEDLSESVHRILAKAFELLDIESAEIALRDSQSGLFHSSFSVGKPFKTELVSSDEGYQNAEDGSVSEPLLFAGTNLGMMRVGFSSDLPLKNNDLYLIRVLALQSALAILNSKYTDELIRMKQTSEDSVKAKTGFLANLSHEIRGPLGTILNAAELVVEGLYGPVSDEQKETLRMIQDNGTHLLDLINDVLDYSKIESGKIVPKPEALNVSEVLADVTAVVRSQAVTKKHKLELRNCAPEWFLTCDRRHLRQMLINLLTNSIKYTPGGGHIEVWADALPQGKIRINVRDNGIGMHKDDHYKVFSPFERIENEYTRNQIGTGLGMPLTKRMAEVNSGTLDFTSEPGSGSHFFLTLPNATAEEVTTAKAGEQELQDAQGTGELIYIFDNDQQEAEMLQRYLKHIGFNAKSFYSIDSALDGTVFGPRLVLISNTILEESGSGVEKIQAIRYAFSQENLPVVLVSSRAFSFDIEDYLRQGIDFCITKPIELKKIGIICRDLIDGRLVTLELGS